MLSIASVLRKILAPGFSKTNLYEMIDFASKSVEK